MSKQIEMILCACGCGQLRPKYDNRGRERKFINNHQNKKLSKKRQLLSKEVRAREEVELKGWAEDITKIKLQITEVDMEIFDQI